jgi:glycosyltransferase involved in cell wall biosynthesis
MKVLYIGGFELPDKNAAAHRVINNGKVFHALGYEVSFCGITHSDDSIDQFTDAQIDAFPYSYRNKRYPEGIKDWFRDLSSIDYYKKIIEKSATHISIVVVYNTPSLMTYLLKRYCSLKGIKLIVDVSEWYVVPKENPLLYRIVKGLDINLSMQFAYKKADGIIAISKFLYKYYDKQNIILVPPLVDIEGTRLRVPLDSFKEAPINLIYSGSAGIGQKDNLIKVLQSLKRISSKVPPFEVLVLGVSSQVVSLKAKELPNVKFLGRLPHAECLSLIKKADYSIFVREFNLVTQAGFPTKFVESISCGTPVLTNANSNVADYLGDDKLGQLLKTDSDEELDVSLVIALSRSRSDIKLMKQYCLKSNVFHFENYIADFKSLISKL